MNKSAIFLKSNVLLLVDMESVIKSKKTKHSGDKKELPAILKHHIMFDKKMLEFDLIQLQKDKQHWNDVFPEE